MVATCGSSEPALKAWQQNDFLLIAFTPQYAIQILSRTLAMKISAMFGSECLFLFLCFFGLLYYVWKTVLFES